VPRTGHVDYAVHGQGRPVVLLHGHTLDRRMWAPVLPRLAGFQVILPDLAGHGLSGPPPEGSTLAGDIAAVLDDLNLPRAAICGLSLGGAAAISFALHYPDRCAGLVAVDAFLFGQPMPGWPGPRPYAQIARSQGLAPALEAWLADPLFAPAMASPAAGQIRSIVQAYSGHAWLNRTPPQAPPGPPEAERLGEIQAPTLVLVGEADLPDFHQVAERLAGEIPNARRVVVPGAGHLLPLEQPDAFGDHLVAFLQTIPWGDAP
jgi:3-oxoadipate enol-lactonase